MNRGIDLYLISGFLGSGKTTFLQNMLLNFQGKKIGVIVNEFGSIGIDGKLVERDGIQLIEINNGSIFCSCLKGSFIKTLIDFSKEDIDILFVENSGMADPSNMQMVLEELKDKIERPFEYKGAVCIVDSVSFLKHVRVLAPVQNQIACSNLIIVNKIDMVNQATIEEINSKILELNSAAYIYQTMYSDVPLSVIEQHLYYNGYVGETSNQCYNRPSTYSLESEGCFTEQQLLDFIQKIQNFILRMKGLAKKENGWWQIDVVGDYVKVTDFKLGKRDIIEDTKIIVIGKDDTPFQKEMEEAFQSICQEKYQIFE